MLPRNLNLSQNPSWLSKSQHLNILTRERTSQSHTQDIVCSIDNSHKETSAPYPTSKFIRLCDITENFTASPNVSIPFPKWNRLESMSLTKVNFIQLLNRVWDHILALSQSYPLSINRMLCRTLSASKTYLTQPTTIFALALLKGDSHRIAFLLHPNSSMVISSVLLFQIFSFETLPVQDLLYIQEIAGVCKDFIDQSSINVITQNMDFSAIFSERRAPCRVRGRYSKWNFILLKSFYSWY